MSDMYLVLRRRLDSVVDWVSIDTETLKSARREAGLSYEAVSRSLHVSAKTWERWEKTGRVPRHMVPRVAAVLGLEIEQPNHRNVVSIAAEPVEGSDHELLLRVLHEVQEIQATQAELQQQQASLDARLEKVLQRLENPERPRGASGS